MICWSAIDHRRRYMRVRAFSAANNTINSMDSSAFTGEIIGGFDKIIVLMFCTKVTNPCQQ